MTTASTLKIALNEARAEIQRLEEIKKTLSLQAAGLLSDIERLKDQIANDVIFKALREEIERLRDILKYERRESASIMPMAEEILCLKERIAELEDLAVLSGWQSLDGDLDGKYIITEAQIDAAWALTSQQCKEYITGGIWKPIGAENALKELGIERCPDQHCANGEDTRPMPCSYPACKVCNGKGWIKT